MFNDNEGKKQLASILSHYLYIDAKIDDFHRRELQMNSNFYYRVYRFVNQRMQNALRYQKLINSTPSLKNISELSEACESLPGEERLAFVKYACAILTYKSMQLCTGDLKPLEKLSHRSIAGYVLGGTFKDSCDKEMKLNDKTNYQINNDVANRVYTLVCSNYFN